MAQAQIKDQEEWDYTNIPNLTGGVKTDESRDIIDALYLTAANNVRFDKSEIYSDNGYVAFQDDVRGNVRLVYQFQKTTGSSELLCITDDTIYKEVGDTWHYISNGTSTTADGGEPAAETDVNVASISGFSDGDYIGVILDDGTQHQTTINGSPAGTTIVMDDAVPAGKAIDTGAAIVLAVTLTGSSTHQVVALTLPSNDWVVFTNNTDNVKRYNGTDVTDVPNMVSSGDCKCRTLAVLAHHLILVNTTEGGTAYPQRERHSDTADPTEWVTGNAGSEDKLDLASAFVAAAPLGPYVILYRDDAIVRMEYIGSADKLFELETMVTGYGCRSSQGVAIMDKSEHAVLGKTSVYKYTGDFTTEELSDNIDLSVFGSAGEISPSLSHSAMTFYLKEYDEIFVMYPTTSATEYCDKAARYKIMKKAWSFRTLPIEMSGFGSSLTDTSVLWSELVGSWAQQTWKWGSAAVTSNSKLLMLGSGTQVYKYDFLSIDDAGTAITWVFDTKEFLSPLWDIRHDFLEFMARGSSVTVLYSTNGGDSWNTFRTVTLSSLYTRYRIEKQFVARSIMYRFTGTGPGFGFRWLGMKTREESSHNMVN